MSSHLTKNSKRSKEIDLGVGNISSYFIGFFFNFRTYTYRQKTSQRFRQGIFNVKLPILPLAKKKIVGHWGLMSVILATQEVEIRRIVVKSQIGK
jgi:hypothetical protein